MLGYSIQCLVQILKLDFGTIQYYSGPLHCSLKSRSSYFGICCYRCYVCKFTASVLSCLSVSILKYICSIVFPSNYNDI
ncbi:hypothetical protein BRADI_3g35253v3 [Brachypodium distachyon]|uniref:Uncharacterized protein n=1 Tax=Brachypodium distachyon TaxID=15368 RepID=A0A2K2D193_BRADI|nr:hypothetical protein BRADI_3g35253v3 [Brachypodium distachyon]